MQVEMKIPVNRLRCDGSIDFNALREDFEKGLELKAGPANLRMGTVPVTIHIMRWQGYALALSSLFHMFLQSTFLVGCIATRVAFELEAVVANLRMGIISTCCVLAMPSLLK